MALTANDGRYLRIDRCFLNSEFISDIHYKIYVNKAHRENGDTEFMRAIDGHLNNGALQDELNSIADNSKSIIDNFKTAGYAAIKADNLEFSNWVDA